MLVGAFTDQAHKLILLANDEARMLRSEAVAPEHLHAEGHSGGLRPAAPAPWSFAGDRGLSGR